MAWTVPAAMLDPAAMKRIVEREFRVYDVREEKIRGQVVAYRFCLIFPPVEFDARFEKVRAALREAAPDLLVFHRREGGEDMLFVAERPPAPPLRPWVHLGLLAATIVTTAISGAIAWASYHNPGLEWNWQMLADPSALGWGFLSFALPLLLILGVHESAHYVVARRHGLRATLPYFIPAPPVLLPIGTFGAFISLKDPLPDRKALFDVGAAGPLAGFMVALPVVILGAFLSAHGTQPVLDIGRPDLFAEGNFTVEQLGTAQSVLHLQQPATGPVAFRVTAPNHGLKLDGDGHWAYRATVSMHFPNGTSADDSARGVLAPGATEWRTVNVTAGADRVDINFRWDDGLVTVGDPLLVQMLNWFFPSGGQFIHPTFFAGWVGLLVTGINLLPAGQLDGGHVARAVFGERMKYVARAAIGFLLILAFMFDTWVLMAFIVLLMGIHHPPPLNDRTRLDTKRWVLAVVVGLVLILTFVPIPFQVAPPI
jgi:membrane-associated protease RseP (regulator of RpoE activity)